MIQHFFLYLALCFIPFILWYCPFLKTFVSDIFIIRVRHRFTYLLYFMFCITVTIYETPIELLVLQFCSSEFTS